jgi:hypothetical protein
VSTIEPSTAANTRATTPSLTLALALAAGAAIAAPAFADTLQVTRPFAGIEHQHITTTIGGRVQSIHAVVVDLAAPGLSFQLTPQNGPAAQMTNEQTTRAFLNQSGAQVAVNTHFFTLDGLPTADLIGLGASNGDAYSPWSSAAGALSAGINIAQNNQATFVIPGTAGGTSVNPNVPLYNAFGVSMTNGANPRIVTSGVRSTNTSSFDTTPNPRTASAILPNNRLLFLTVDGRQTGVAEGVTLPELADLLIARFGAVDAVNLDGGGSTTLAMNHAGTRVMNAPVGVGSGQAAINTERANGANLAIFATRLYGQEPARELLASESFNYQARAWGTDANTRPTSGSVNSLSGGTGFASPWNDTGARWAGIAVQGQNFALGGTDARTTPLAYTDAAGNTVQSAGGQLRGSFGTSSTSSRELDLSLVPSSMIRPSSGTFAGELGADGTTLWLSFLAQSASGSGTTGTTQRFGYLQLGASLRLGKLENSTTGNWGAQDAAGGVTRFSALSSATQVMYLAQIEFRAGAEIVNIWLNPASLTDQSLLGAPTMTLSVNDFGFSDISIVNRFSTDFDELRLGTTFRSVVPAPGAAGALIAVGLIAATRRRRPA